MTILCACGSLPSHLLNCLISFLVPVLEKSPAHPCTNACTHPPKQHAPLQLGHRDCHGLHFTRVARHTTALTCMNEHVTIRNGRHASPSLETMSIW